MQRGQLEGLTVEVAEELNAESCRKWELKILLINDELKLLRQCGGTERKNSECFSLLHLILRSS